MKPSTITAILGMILLGIGICLLIKSISMGGIVPILIGGSLVYLALSRESRVAILVFGHTCVVIGAYLTTWGILLLPYCEPRMAHIFGRPLFWGIFSLMGGICAIFHGFCRCVTKQVEEFEGSAAVKSGVKKQ